MIGIPYGLVAIAFFVWARLCKSTGWNPAERYLDWAARFAVMGGVLTLILIAMAMTAAIPHGSHRHLGLYSPED